MALESWLFFMAIWIAASIPLGPNALNCISTSAAFGLRKGLWSVMGVFLAAIVHMTLAVSGMAAFLSTHPGLFEIVRWFGVAYLAWMGIAMLRSSGRLEIAKSPLILTNQQLIRRAALISLTNPKAIFAWMAVFSQFIDVAAPLAPQLAILGPSALSVTLAVYAGYCVLGFGVNRVFAGARKRWFDRITGSTYLAFAAVLASSDLRRI